MSRSYAQVMRIDRSKSDVHLKWLEHILKHEEEIPKIWTAEELPIAWDFWLGENMVNWSQVYR
jgi:hypothetical protein